MEIWRKWFVKYLFWFLFLWFMLESIAAGFLWNAPIQQEKLPADDLMPFDPNTLWYFQPNSILETNGLIYQIDAHSMRQGIATEGTDSMLFVGDSSTFGLRVAAKVTLPEQSATCSSLKPLNAGVSGYSTLKIAAQLPNLLDDFSPKWVVLVVPWSDMMHTSVTDAERIERAQRVVMIRRVMAAPLIRSSFVVRWLIRTAQRRMNANPITLEPLQILQPRERGETRRVSATKHLENIKRIHSMVVQSQARLLLIQLPINRRYPTPARSILRSYREPVLKWAKMQDVRLVDGDALLRERPKSERGDWFADPIHPSAKGHFSLAQSLCNALKH